jgi:hypothetical protein
MRPDPQSSGDYGYDLVHEEIGRAKKPAPPPGREPGAPEPPPPPGPAAELPRTADLGYDEAHDF